MKRDFMTLQNLIYEWRIVGEKLTRDKGCEKAFVELKGKLVLKPILFAPNFSKDFILQKDAKDIGAGVVLSQKINGMSELGPRRHKKTYQQCVLFAPDPVTTARLETHNVYPDIGAHGVRAGMRWNRWDRLKDNSSKEPSPIKAGKGQNIRG
ncbi:hypothetical protein TNCV_2366831 [Trichonephila clavipes]|nr:hypothetical protein TNCV_2366831 [Trichonephila clavipes]